MDHTASAERRSERAHRAVLTSSLELLHESGYARVTIDAIAARSGVSKATIYRWWRHKAAILVEAFLASVEPQIAFPDSGSLREDLVAQVASLAAVLGDPDLGALFVALLAEAQGDAEVADALRDGWQTPRRAAGTEVVERARIRGEIDEGTDPDLVLDGVYGPLYLRLLFGHAPLDEESIRPLVDQVLRGVSPAAPASDD